MTQRFSAVRTRRPPCGSRAPRCTVDQSGIAGARSTYEGSRADFRIETVRHRRDCGGGGLGWHGSPGPDGAHAQRRATHGCLRPLRPGKARRSEDPVRRDCRSHDNADEQPAGSGPNGSLARARGGLAPCDLRLRHRPRPGRAHPDGPDPRRGRRAGRRPGGAHPERGPRHRLRLQRLQRLYPRAV
jgi:hypothetical protein